jgi:hypothetical protein
MNGLTATLITLEEQLQPNKLQLLKIFSQNFITISIPTKKLLINSSAVHVIDSLLTDWFQVFVLFATITMLKVINAINVENC